MMGRGLVIRSVRRCPSCVRGWEQYCSRGYLLSTYNADERGVPGVKTKGGYSDHVVVDEECAFACSQNFIHVQKPKFHRR